LKPTLTAGMFAGSLTNTPALAAIIEHIKATAHRSLCYLSQSSLIL
jgi:uncharacterized transporter YbjL